MPRIFSIFFLVLLSATFVGLPTPSIAKSVSHSEKCHLSKEMKAEHAKAVVLKSTSCQHQNHTEKCSNCSVSCCQISVIGLATDLTPATLSVTQEVVFSYLSPTVKNFHKGLFRPPIV